MIYKGFGSIKDARRFVSTHFSEMWDDCKPYSAHATSDGRGRDSFVSITKTDRRFKEKLNQHAKDRKELEELQPLLNQSSGNIDTKRRRLSAESGVATKRRIIIDLTDD